jgi:antitoxin component of RelBE/YafQ-DinJ toxin-antitoxin module
MKIIEKTFDIATGEETIIERDETAQEIAERLEREAKFAEAQAEAEAKATARQAVFEKLGLTPDEVAALLL